MERKKKKPDMKEIAVFLFVFIACMVYGEEESSALNNAWKDFTSAGKSAVQEAGNFFNEAGKKVEEGFSEASQEFEKMTQEKESGKENTLIGKWKYNGGKTVTVITINKDGTMEVEQKEGLKTSFWRGTYKETGSSLTFSYTETGTREFLTEKIVVSSGKWKIRYSFEEDGIIFFSKDIPKDSSGNGFSDGRLFE